MCEHNKVYAGKPYEGVSTRHPWICKACWERGSDEGTFESNVEEFSELVSKIEEERRQQRRKEIERINRGEYTDG